MTSNSLCCPDCTPSLGRHTRFSGAIDERHLAENAGMVGGDIGRERRLRLNQAMHSRRLSLREALTEAVDLWLEKELGEQR